MQEIGHAALAIIPSFDGFQSKLEAGSTKAMAVAGDKGGKALGSAAGDKATSELSAKISDWSKKGAIALGGAAGFAVGYGFREAIDRERVGDRIAASLGLSPKQQQQQGKIAGSLYAKAFGDSYEEAGTAVAATVSSIKGLRGNGEIRRATADALNFASVFEVDVSRAVQVAGTVINNGLAKDAESAFDLLTRSSQKVPAQLREDLLDAAEEYGGFFKTLGYSGPQAFDLLVAGSKQGIYGIDKAGDAIKEFTIRSTDGSKSTGLALESIGLNAQKMSDDILAGGDTAQDATQKIIQGLLDIEDPSQRAQTAIALFGTPMEDLNVSKIPAFLRALQGTSGELDNVKGAADRMGDTLSDNVSTDITKMKRKLENDLVEFISKKGLPALESFTDWVTDDAGPAFRNFKDDIKPVTDAVGDLVDIFGDLPTSGKIASIAGLIGGGLVVKHKLAGIFDRGGPANPMFVVVTNPTGAPGLPGVDTPDKPRGPGGKVIPFVKNAAKALPPVLIIAGTAYAVDELIFKPAKENATRLEPTRQGFDSTISSIEGVENKAKGYGKTLDLVGSKKVEPLFAVPGLAKGREGLEEFLRLQIRAGKPITPYIYTSPIERALALMRDLNAEISRHAMPSRGADGSVPYLHGGTGESGGDGNGRAGVVANFYGGINGSTIPDVMTYAQRKMQAQGIGGF